MAKKLRILVLINAHSIAHVTRPLEISKVLRARGHQIAFAGCGKYLEVARLEGFESIDLPGLPVDRMREVIRTGKGSDLYRVDELGAWIESELALYKTFKPDLIISDNRITASTSAEVAKIKMVSILNSHMTMFREIPFYSVRRTAIGKIPFLSKILDILENKIEFALWNLLVSSNLNTVRARLGLAKKYAYRIDEGELNLVPDLPEFNPLLGAPKNFVFLGPLTWNSVLPAPECRQKLDKNKKTVYFTIGSEGLDDLIAQIPNCFDLSKVQIVISTGGVAVDPKVIPAGGVFIEKYVNAAELLPRCDLVVCHGGNGTIYQALTYGVPVLGISTHEEQFYCIKRVIDLGLGLGFRSKDLNKHGLKLVGKTATKILNSLSIKNNVQEYQRKIKAWSGAELGSQAIEQVMEN